ncbi:hypothetical protein BT69DRAFT_1049769 [Atractiella rhizophila]|nr:hypothetical protein BT69DRAFT_1049769 [Atractiella rhizophila]
MLVKAISRLVVRLCCACRVIPRSLKLFQLSASFFLTTSRFSFSAALSCLLFILVVFRAFERDPNCDPDIQQQLANQAEMSSFPPTSPTLPSHSNSLTSSTTHASYTSSAPIMAHPSPSLPAGYNRHSFLDPHQPLSPPPPHTTADVPLGSAGLPQGAAYQPQRSSYIPDAPEDGRYVLLSLSPLHIISGMQCF